jgi:hypothetical protein
LTQTENSCYNAYMSDAVRESLVEGIEKRRRELAELESALKKHDLEAASVNGKSRRRRKASGFRADSVPFHVDVVLRASNKPMGAAELADALKARGKVVDSRMIASSLNRYIGKNFERTPDGLYLFRGA